MRAKPAARPSRALDAVRCIALSIVMAGPALASGQETEAPPGPSSEAKEEQKPEERPLPPEVPRPEFMDRRPFIPDFLLRNKKEGINIQPIPAIGYDAEQGLNLGVLGEIFNNGSKDDPFFRTAPYRWKLSTAAVLTTSGTQRYIGYFDHPYFLESPYRLRAFLGYDRDDNANYFGVGDDGNQKLHFPGSPNFFNHFDDYQDAIEQRTNGTTYAKFNKWKSQDTIWGLVGERDLFGGIVRPLLGLQFRYTHVGDYTGEQVDAKGGSAIENPTKLLTDHQAGVIDGFDGGWDNYLKAGISVDTRDFEPDPSSGILGQVVSEISTRYLGSDFDYQRVTSSLSGYQDVLPGDGRLVLAGRGLYSMQFGSVPFYNLHTLAQAERDREGLGAFESLRGYKRERFIGQSAVLVGSELRWSITEWNFWNQNLRPILTPFIDAGRAFDGTALKLEDWHLGYGIGLKLAWNLATIVSFDYGVSQEDSVFYMELGHQF